MRNLDQVVPPIRRDSNLSDMQKSKSDNVSHLDGKVPDEEQYDAVRQLDDAREFFNKKPSKIIRRFNSVHEKITPMKFRSNPAQKIYLEKQQSLKDMEKRKSSRHSSSNEGSRVGSKSKGSESNKSVVASYKSPLFLANLMVYKGSDKRRGNSVMSDSSSMQGDNGFAGGRLGQNQNSFKCL